MAEERYLCPKGKVFYSKGAESTSFYALKEAGNPKLKFSDIRKGVTKGKNERYPIILDNITFGKRDVVAPMLCFNNIKVLYRFGTDFTPVSIQGRLLLGTSDNQDSEAFNNLTAWFDEHRVVSKGTPITISIIGKETIECFLTGLDFGNVNSEMNTQSWVITGLGFERIGAKVDNPADTTGGGLTAGKPGTFTGVAGMLGKMNAIFSEEGAIGKTTKAVNSTVSTAVTKFTDAHKNSGFDAMMEQGSALASNVRETSQTARNWATGKYEDDKGNVVSILDEPNKTLNQIIGIQDDAGGAFSNVTGIKGDWQKGRPYARSKRKIDRIANFSF
jgi:hypothetical protein